MPDTASAPLPVRRRSSAMPRRALFALAGASAVALGGCGPVQLGSPPTYTPPPPGIDDLYRVDLIALLERAAASVDALREESGSGGDPSDGGGSPSDGGGAGEPPDARVDDALSVLSAALPVQRQALLTGAQAEREQEQSEDPDPHLDPTPDPTDVPTDVDGLMVLLVDLRELCVDAARQVSGSLARPVCAIGAHSAWAALRLHQGSGQGAVPAPRAAAEIKATRTVPDQDPPSIGAESDYHAALEAAQEQEWYTAYAHEVLAANSEGTARDDQLEAVDAHRARAEALAEIAEEDGAPVVARQAVYALPGGTVTGRSTAQLPTLLADGLLVAHIALVGAAPFERRALSIQAALSEAGELASLVGRIDPLPSLEPEDLPTEE